MTKKLQDIDISISDIGKLYHIRSKINEDMIRLTHVQNAYTIDCPLSNGILQLSLHTLPRGLIFIMDDNNELRWVIKVVIGETCVRLLNPLALIDDSIAWMNRTSPEYKIVCDYISDFLRECFTITEFDIYSRETLSPNYKLINYQGQTIYLD